MFTSVGGFVRPLIAALDANTGVNDGTWNANAFGNAVESIVVNGSSVILGGDFVSMGGQARKNLAAVDITTGNGVPGWSVTGPDPDGDVHAITFDNGIAYFGGSFGIAGGVARNHIAAVNIADGSIVNSFNPNADGDVNALTSFRGMIYAGGAFTNIAGKPFNFIA